MALLMNKIFASNLNYFQYFKFTTLVPFLVVHMIYEKIENCWRYKEDKIKEKIQTGV